MSYTYDQRLFRIYSGEDGWNDNINIKVRDFIEILKRLSYYVYNNDWNVKFIRKISRVISAGVYYREIICIVIGSNFDKNKKRITSDSLIPCDSLKIISN